MERSRRLYDLWNWLVPFRVAAETESLGEASKMLHVASSAISRSVKLLEERIEIQLFDRRPGSMLLNESGSKLLASVRRAMRILDDGIVDALGEELSATVYFSCPGELVPAFLPALRNLRDSHPGIRPSMGELEDAEALGALRQGRIDLAIVRDDVVDEHLEFRPLRQFDRGIFVAIDHPASGAGQTTLDELEFAVLVDAEGTPLDGFPNHLKRRIALRCEAGASVIESLRASWLAASLPRVVGEEAGMIELAIEDDLASGLAPYRLSVAHRPCINRPGPGDILADAIVALRGA